MPHALIIEDEDDNRQILVNLVQAEGHTYAEAACLTEARELLNSQDFDFVLLDLKIPLRPGNVIMRDHGDKCLQEIRSHPRNKTAGIVVVTSSEDRDLAIEKMRQGANDYLWKPIQEQSRKLSDCIANALEARDRLRQQSAPTSNGMQPFEGATLVFGADRVHLGDCVICASLDTKQAKVLRYLAEHNGERPTAEMISIDLGYHVGENGGAASVHKAISVMRNRAKAYFEEQKIELGPDGFISNRRGGTGYEFGPKIKIEGLLAAEPAGAKKRRRK